MYSFRTPNRRKPTLPPSCDIDPDKIYNDSYYVAIINMAKEAEKWGRCLNCEEEGHCWADYTRLLKESLKQAKERANHKKQAFNRDGGAEAKGAWPPKQEQPRPVWPKPKTNRPPINSLRILE